MLSASQKLDALAWAAKEANCSYGAFRATLSLEREDQIFMDYEELLRERKAKEAAWVRRGYRAKKAGPAKSAAFTSSIKPVKKPIKYQIHKYLNPAEVSELLASSSDVLLHDLDRFSDM